MRVLFRTDTSIEIGTGHLVRCLALADSLIERGDDVHFETNADIKNTKITIHRSIPSQLSFDWVVFDLYSLDHDDELLYRAFCKRIAVIDDHGRRKHDADLIIDPSISSETDSRKKANSGIPFFSGADFLLLRKDFVEAHRVAKPRETFQRILVFFGGTDPQRLTLPYLKAIQDKDSELKHLNFSFLVSSLHPDLHEIQNHPSSDIIEIVVAPPSVASVMMKSDFYLGSSGTISWERMCLGLTGLVMSVVDNQEDLSQTLHDEGFHQYLGKSADFTPDIALTRLLEALSDRESLSLKSKLCIEKVDAQGVKRVTELLK